MAIISLHLPKTAGTSFGASLRTHFGDRYRSDYSDGGISRPQEERRATALSSGCVIAEHGLWNVDCVHGHFLPVKYLQLSARCDLKFVTWMRDPVQRLLSHYYFWQKSYDEATSSPHHRHVIEHGWTLEKFCMSEKFRNIYTQYLWEFPLEHFSFIGISERYEEDLRDFSKCFLSTDLEPLHLNETGYVSQRDYADKAFLDRVRDFHAADVRLYQRALDLRQSRLRLQPSKQRKHDLIQTFMRLDDYQSVH
ncbi:sulfotransferase family 2 domain-containing protein [Dyella psychrodurans]|uniref:Sulfotransferase family protein n=1 Tax=Dyella psychrodurans TaxID=1927960 RepID=A0A370WYE1_9GAMM|nr:sulfotransferase family 2 domain-containing protein [Dyella psychrodurans]RDS80995.1 hypothetical protein DWU99_18250 [Dyella psychrodurans]